MPPWNYLAYTKEFPYPFFAVAGAYGLYTALIASIAFELRGISGSLPPDGLPLHSAQTLTDLFDTYGAYGISLYHSLGFFDTLYPLFYVLFLGSVLYMLFPAGVMRQSAWLPSVMAGIDFAENYFLKQAVALYPTIPSQIANLSGVLVFLKICVLFLCVFLIVWGVARLPTSKKT